jgi:hypothetical protein
MLLPCPDDSSGERPFRQPSAELLGQCDDDAFGAADVAEPIAVLVLRQLANEFGAVGVQAGKGKHSGLAAVSMPWVAASGAVRSDAARPAVRMRQERRSGVGAFHDH